MSEENIEDGTKLNSNFAPIFVNNHVLPNIWWTNFDGNSLINNISASKKVKTIYIS